MHRKVILSFDKKQHLESKRYTEFLEWRNKTKENIENNTNFPEYKLEEVLYDLTINRIEERKKNTCQQISQISFADVISETAKVEKLNSLSSEMHWLMFEETIAKRKLYHKYDESMSDEDVVQEIFEYEEAAQ